MKKIFKTKGMHCNSCEMLVKDSLEEIDGVNSAKANHKSGDVIVDYEDSVSETRIKDIIHQEGYEVL